MRICNLSSSVPYKKNPFLGPELVCFANPTSPDTGPLDSGEKAEGQVFEDLKNVVPGRMEYDHEKRWEIQAHWLSMVGDYNGIQNHIKKLQASRKELLDDRIFNKPHFKKQFQALVKPKYQELLQITQTLGTGVEAGAMKRIRENAAADLEVTRGEAVADTDAVIRALLAERKERARMITEVMRENLTERLAHLKTQWETATPNGYADVKDGWIAYTNKLTETLAAQDLSAMDNGDPNFPVANTVYDDAKKWWEMVSKLEDSYADFVQYGEGKEVDTGGAFVELTDEKLAAAFDELKKKAKEEMEGETLKTFKANADKILARERDLAAKIQQKIESTTGEDKKFWEDQLTTLKDKVKELEDKKDLEGMIKAAFTSKKVVATFDAPNGEGKIPVPEGIEGQLEFLRNAPMSNAARRAAARTLLEGMKEVGKNISKYKEFGDVQAVEALENMRLFEDSMDMWTGETKREIIWVNPFETMGHVWHSITNTIKGNVETEAKRGAGYFQRDATKILTHIPNPTNNQVIKSLTELHPNGAQEAEHAEHGRVSEIEKGYESFNSEHLMHLAAETVDRWEFKACLNILAKRGRVDFYAPWIFKQLNRWQKTIKMPEDRYWHQKNLTASDEMLRQAYVYIYRDSEAYKSLKNTNTSSYESKMGEFSKNWGSIAAEPGALEREAEKILEHYESDHHAGIHFSKADPMKFESIIRYAVDQGKMKAERRLALLARGIASGLLPFDRGVNATDKNNTYPPFDWFDAPTIRGGRPTIDDIRELAAYAKDPVVWDVYMNGEVNYNELVNQRLDKTMSQGSHRVDHDDAPMLAGFLKVGTRRDLLTQKTAGGYGMPVTGLLSLATGDEFWLDLYAEKFKSRSQELNKMEIIRFGTSFLMGEGILNRRVYKSQNNMFRLEPDTAASPPRAGGSYAKVFGRNAKAGTGSILKGVAQHLTTLDFDPSMPLIKKLVNDEIKTNADAARICANLDHEYGIFKGSPPDTIDKLYDSLSSYIEYAVENHYEDCLRSMAEGVNSQHSQHIDQILSKPNHEVEGIRGEALRRAQGLPEPAHHGHDENHEGEHPAEGGAHPPAAGGSGTSAHGSTPVGGGPAAHGSTHGH